jgi:hypothetical protein
VRVLTAGRPKTVKVVGDVVGMPEGIIRTAPESDDDTPWWVILSVWSIAQAACLAAAAWVFWSVTGSWSHVWLLVLPIAALVIPLVGTSYITASQSGLRRAAWRRRSHPDFAELGVFPLGLHAFEAPLVMDPTPIGHLSPRQC